MIKHVNKLTENQAVFEFFRELHADVLNEEAHQEKEVRATTVRIGAYEMALADALAEDLKTSRNAILTDIIEQGIWTAIHGAASVMTDSEKYVEGIVAKASKSYKEQAK